MKQQAIQYLAFDVHKATVVASLRDASGRIVMKATVATEAKAILRLVESAGPRYSRSLEHGLEGRIVIAVQTTRERCPLASLQLAVLELLIGARSRHHGPGPHNLA